MSIWATKHRPKKLNEVIGQDEIVNELKVIVSGKAPMQHYLFHSPEAGTGKTSVANAMAKELGWQLVVFNASSKKERGIDFIEETIIPLTRSGLKERIFFLDEADQLTDAAQSALKGVIENANGFFILACNNLNKVSRWLQSRCQVRTFKPIPQADIVKRLRYIVAQEGMRSHLSGGLETLDIIAKAHAGDLRNAIGATQSYIHMTVTDQEKFLDSLTTPDINYKVLLRLCFLENGFDEALKMFVGEVREQVRETFRYAVNSGANAESKMKVIESAVVAERDIINGVDAEIVRHNFIRMLVGGNQ